MRPTELTELAGVTYRKIDFWLRKGYLKIDSPTPGSGYRREFSDREVENLKLLSSVFGVITGKEGARQRDFRPIADSLSEVVDLWSNGAGLAIDNNGVAHPWAYGDDLSEIISKHGSCIVVQRGLRE